jgi:hypothetical protein
LAIAAFPGDWKIGEKAGWAAMLESQKTYQTRNDSQHPRRTDVAQK